MNDRQRVHVGAGRRKGNGDSGTEEPLWDS